MGDEPPAEGRVSLLDYLETELTFVEFRRILVRIADRQTVVNDPTSMLSQRLPLHRRFEGFLKHIFLPAFLQPYQPPVPECEEGDIGLEVQIEGGDDVGMEEAAPEPS